MKHHYSTANESSCVKWSRIVELFIVFCLVIIPVDVCLSDPCQYGGVCFKQGTGYLCACADGYTGVNCEIGKVFPFLPF